MLLEEHRLLLKAVGITKKIQEISDDKVYYNVLHDMIIFFRNFSELYHHPKEENVFYPVLKKHSNVLSSDFINEICDNHEDIKSGMADIENSYVAYDYQKLRSDTGKYLLLIEEHIKRENRMILSVAPSLITETENKMIQTEFCLIDEKNGDKEDLIESLFRISMNIA